MNCSPATARRATGALLLFVVGVSLPACGDRGAAPVPGVLLVTIDTLRADALGCYGAPAGASPHIDELASRSVVFERAYTQATHTHAALSAMMTGLAPPVNGVLAQAGELHGGVVPLATALREHGVETASFVANMCQLQSRPSTVFADGWDEMFCGLDMTSEQYLWDEAVTSAALAWLEEREGPWFGWVHMMDPHGEHRPPPDLWDYEQRPVRSKAAQAIHYGRFEQRGEMPPGSDVAMLRELYAAQVRGVDRQVARLTAFVDALPEERRPAIVFTSDHGEELFETWPKSGHGISLTEGVLHVPLVVSVPGAEPGRRTELAETLQVAPTILELFDVPAPYELGGASLLGPAPADAVAISYCDQVASMRSGELRLWSESDALPRTPQFERYLSILAPEDRPPWFRLPALLATYDGPSPTMPTYVDPTDDDGGPGVDLELHERLHSELEALGPVQPPVLVEDPALDEQLRELGYAGHE